MILAKSSSSFTTFSTNVARCFSSTKSRTAGRQEQRIIDPPGAKCLAHAPQRIRLGHLRPVKIAIFSYALLACCTDFSDALLDSLHDPFWTEPAVHAVT